MLHDQDTADAELTALEAALRSLTPARIGLDRDRVMFAAGQAKAGRSRALVHGWATLSVLLAIISLGEGALLVRWQATAARSILLATQEGSHNLQHSALLPTQVSVAEPTSSSVATDNWNWPALADEQPRDRLTAQVLRYGLDGLPGPVATPRDDSKSWTLRSRQELADELRKDLELGGPS